MKDLKKIATSAIEEKSEVFTSLSDKIWEYAELSLKEYKSAAEYVKLLSELGFEVEEKLSGIDTAFLGKFGTGAPVIGILGEFDALSGLSQKGASVEKEPVTFGGNGHGCGHNMLGAGALAAAYGVKEYLRKTQKSGTVIFFGTPGEEGGAGKAFMAKEGTWRGLDAAITWHPSDVNEVVSGTCNSCIQVLYKFRGVASHAAGDPENGRSALDAVELMNTGVQYLREHVKSDARIHYAIIDGGGFSPNVVQPTASVLYMTRSLKVKDTLELQARVDKIAEGAAIMTETSYERVFIDGCSNTLPNHTLEKLLYKNMNEVGVASYTDGEWEFAKALKSTYGNSGLPTTAAKYDASAAELVKKLSENGEKALCDFIAPLFSGEFFEAGSTDVGDVSWQTPTAQINTVCFAAGSPGHSWQNVSMGKSSIGHKGLISAGKILAAAAVELFETPALLAEAKEEFKKAAAEGYVCPIPENEFAKAIEL